MPANFDFFKFFSNVLLILLWESLRSLHYFFEKNQLRCRYFFSIVVVILTSTSYEAFFCYVKSAGDMSSTIYQFKKCSRFLDSTNGTKKLTKRLILLCSSCRKLRKQLFLSTQTESKRQHA